MSKAYLHEMITMSDDALSGELENIKLDEFRKVVKRALKEQDRDTRHACAEAVIALESYPDGGGISKTHAHNACMNVKAV